MTDAGVGMSDDAGVVWPASAAAEQTTSAPARSAASEVCANIGLLHGSDLNATCERLLHGAAVGNLLQALTLLGGQVAMQLDHLVDASRTNLGRLAREAILDVCGRVAK